MSNLLKNTHTLTHACNNERYLSLPQNATHFLSRLYKIKFRALLIHLNNILSTQCMISITRTSFFLYKFFSNIIFQQLIVYYFFPAVIRNITCKITITIKMNAKKRTFILFRRREIWKTFRVATIGEVIPKKITRLNI